MILHKPSRAISSDKNIFNVDEKFDRQNERVYAHSSWEAIEKNSKSTSSSFSDDLVGNVI